MKRMAFPRLVGRHYQNWSVLSLCVTYSPMYKFEERTKSVWC